ncbi:hypothetical protein EVAR_73915_1 [Eumeta japonica]|uniref:Uncharacterized protein n=1 Tax=Eumeta variegata TaxID=151549 RepID=A0A4C1TFR1_EUMVA|nr:hypothetical protein EVAR_73915_1 [Eumeta japonica]
MIFDVAYQQTVLEIPVKVVAARLRRDVRNVRPLEGFEDRKEASPKPKARDPIQYISKLLPALQVCRAGGVTWSIHTPLSGEASELARPRSGIVNRGCKSTKDTVEALSR